MQGVGGGMQQGQALKKMMTAQGAMAPAPQDPPMPEQLAGPPPDPSMMPQGEQQPDMGGMLKQALMRLFMPQQGM